MSGVGGDVTRPRGFAARGGVIDPSPSPALMLAFIVFPCNPTKLHLSVNCINILYIFYTS